MFESLEKSGLHKDKTIKVFFHFIRIIKDTTLKKISKHKKRKT